MLGLILMTLLYLGVTLYAIIVYKDKNMDFKELLMIAGTLLSIGGILIYNFIKL